MARPGSGKCTIDFLKGRVANAGMKFIDSPTVKKAKDIHDPSAFVKIMFETNFDVPYEWRHTVALEPGEVRRFENRLNEVRRKIGKGKLTGKFGEYLYNTSARARSNPYASKLLDRLIDVNYNYKGRQDEHTRLFRNVLDGIKTDVKADGFMSKGERNLKKAIKRADKLDEGIQKAIAKGDVATLEVLRRQEGDFYKTGEGKVFKKVIDIIEQDIPKYLKI